MILVSTVVLWYYLFNANVVTYSEKGKEILGAIEAMINTDKYSDLLETRNTEDPYLLELNKQFQTIKEINHFAYLYAESYDKDGKTTIYTLDGTDPSDEKFGQLGENVNSEDNTQSILNALTNGEFSYEKPVRSDEWGYLMSCYYPIKNSAGQTIGVLAMDLSADFVVKETQKVLLIIQGLTVAFALLTGIGIYIFLSIDIAKPLIKLSNKLVCISTGDFTTQIDDDILNRHDEIGQISSSMNTMVTSLRTIMQDVTDSSRLVAATAEALEISASQNGQAVEQVAIAATEISSSNLEISKVTLDLNHSIQIVNNQSIN